MATETDEKRSSFTIVLWKIENISHCWLKKGEKLETPAFIADELEDTKWSLWLYPMGVRDERFVALYLHRSSDCSGPNEIEVIYKFAFLDKDGKVLKSTNLPKFNFQKQMRWGFPKFEVRDKVFTSEREAFLPEDTLTVACIISGNKITAGPKSIFVRTVFKVNRMSFVWRINKFSLTKSGLKNSLKDNSIEFDLVLNEGLDLEKKVIIKVDSVDPDIKYFSFKTSIVDSEGKKINCGTQEYFLDDLKKGVVGTLLFTDKLIENKSKYLPNDALSLDCECVYSNGAILYQHYGHGEIFPKLENKKVESGNECNISKDESLNVPDLVSDLKFMCNDKIFSDMEIRTPTKTFPSHKNILSARSQVFRSMLSCDMKEKNSGHVDITDFEDDTIHQMLLFIYTDSLEDLKQENAPKIYAIADKYQILSLKSRCSSFLKQNLCQTNACDILVLADLHNDDDLKIAVQDYILGQGKEILCSQEWKDFMNINLKLAADVMYRKIHQE